MKKPVNRYVRLKSLFLFQKTCRRGPCTTWMLHVLSLGYQENIRATVGDGCLGELLTEALPWHQGWEKRRKRMQKPAGLLSAVREALSRAGRMFCWQRFSAFLHGASFSTVIFSPWFVRRSASPTKDSTRHPSAAFVRACHPHTYGLKGIEASCVQMDDLWDIPSSSRPCTSPTVGT